MGYNPINYRYITHKTIVKLDLETHQLSIHELGHHAVIPAARSKKIPTHHGLWYTAHAAAHSVARTHPSAWRRTPVMGDVAGIPRNYRIYYGSMEV